MRFHRRFALAVGISCLALFACSSDDAGEPAAVPSVDASSEEDAFTPSDDAGTTPDTDGGPDASDDAGSDDAGSDAGDGGIDDVTITDILGTLEGKCGEVRALLTSPSPALVTDHLVFVGGEVYERAALSSGGQTMYDTPNAGGSSEQSEVVSYEILHYCEGASLLKTETQIGYDTSKPGGITDILVQIDGKKVGVSVTRSYKPSNQTYTDAMVKDLLEKKLKGVNESSSRVLPADKWVKQVLHVFTANADATAAVERVYPTIASDLRADTIVLLTETKGGGFIYCNPDPPLGSECP